MSKNKKDKNTVFVEGGAVVTTASPYDQYRDIEFEYVSENGPQGTLGSKKSLRLECIKLALQTNKNLGEEHIIGMAKRYYQYLKTGE